MPSPRGHCQRRRGVSSVAGRRAGLRQWIDPGRGGHVVRRFEEIEPFSLWRLLYYLDYILQPAAFFRRDALLQAGWLDEHLEYALDWTCGFDWPPGATSGIWMLTWLSRGCTPPPRRAPGLAAHPRAGPAHPCAHGPVLDPRRAALRPGRAGSVPGAGRGHGPWRAVRGAQGWLSRRITERLPLHADGWMGPRGRLAVPRGGAVRRWSSRCTACRPCTHWSSRWSAEHRQLARVVAEGPAFCRGVRAAGWRPALRRAGRGDQFQFPRLA